MKKDIGNNIFEASSENLMNILQQLNSSEVMEAKVTYWKSIVQQVRSEISSIFLENFANLE